MAINIYGSCYGNDGDAYDISLKVKQNSQNTENNTSNITISLYLKRNDGYKDSVYSTDIDKNTATITVNDLVKVSKNLEIDTRNNVKVLLATWTGDVTHNSDGTLSINVGGSFTIDNTSLTGGSVSSVFECTDIPKISTLSLSASVVNPGDVITAQISSSSDLFSHEIKWSLGKVTDTSVCGENVSSCAFTVPVSWVNEVTTSKSAIASVTLLTFNGDKNIGSKNYTLKFMVPDTEVYKPDFTFSLERIDNQVPSSFEEYVKGMSQVKVAISSVNLKYGATLSSSKATINSVSKSLPETFDLTHSGEIPVSVIVTDSRGLSTEKTTVISVHPYIPPSLDIDTLTRCDENGIRSVNGTHVFLKCTPNYSSINSKNTVRISYKYRASNSSVYSQEIPVTDTTCVLPEGVFDETNSYVLVFYVYDGITSKGVKTKRSVSSVNIPFNIRKGGKGAAFGCYSENDNELTVAWNLNVKGQLAYEDVEIDLSDKVLEKRGIIRYIPCMEIAFVRLRFMVSENLPANENHILGTLSGKIPSLLTPLNVSINTSVEKNANGAIKSSSGELVVNSSSVIGPGDNIYVSGIFFAYKE